MKPQMITIEFWQQEEIIWDEYKTFCARTKINPDLDTYRAFSGGYRAANKVRATDSNPNSNPEPQSRKGFCIGDRVKVDLDNIGFFGRVRRFPQDAPDWMHVTSEPDGSTWNILCNKAVHVLDD